MNSYYFCNTCNNIVYVENTRYRPINMDINSNWPDACMYCAQYFPERQQSSNPLVI